MCFRTWCLELLLWVTNMLSLTKYYKRFSPLLCYQRPRYVHWRICCAIWGICCAIAVSLYQLLQFFGWHFVCIPGEIGEYVVPEPNDCSYCHQISGSSSDKISGVDMCFSSVYSDGAFSPGICFSSRTSVFIGTDALSFFRLLSVGGGWLKRRQTGKTGSLWPYIWHPPSFLDRNRLIYTVLEYRLPFWSHVWLLSAMGQYIIFQSGCCFLALAVSDHKKASLKWILSNLTLLSL